MSAFLAGVDPFDGLREFPREPEQLLHHLSRVNHTMQTRYYIAPDIAEFALQPDKAAGFEKFYQKEVQQIIAHLNKATRSNIKVKVDAARIARGVQIIRDRRHGSSSATPAVGRPEQGDASWQASMTATAKKLADQHLADYQCMLAGGNASAAGGITPAYSSRKHVDDLLMSTGGGNGVVDSMAKPHKDSFLFTTPPEFKGFNNGPNSTPSMVDTRSPGGY